MINNQCLKQTTVAIIMKNNQLVGFGYNKINSNINICERDRLQCKSGERYDICQDVCNQENHAEAAACIDAGENAIDGTLYLIGHTYCCENCVLMMIKHGIKKVIICDTGKIIYL